MTKQKTRINYVYEEEIFLVYQMEEEAWMEKDFEITSSLYPELEFFVMTAFSTDPKFQAWLIPWKAKTIIYKNQEEVELFRFSSKDLDYYGDGVKEVIAKRTNQLPTRVDLNLVTVTVENSKQFREQAWRSLKDYCSLFIEGNITGMGSEPSFNTIFNAFSAYITELSKVTNNKTLSVSNLDLLRYLTKVNQLYDGQIDDIKLLTFISILKFSNLIDVKFIRSELNKFDSKKGLNYIATFECFEETITLDKIFSAFDISSKPKENITVIPIQGNWSYDGKSLFVHRNGLDKPDYIQISYSGRVKNLRQKIFETFYYLWVKDNKGKYSWEEVKNKYFQLHKEYRPQSKLLDDKANMAKLFINDQIFSKVIEWEFDKHDQCWIFRINIG